MEGLGWKWQLWSCGKWVRKSIRRKYTHHGRTWCLGPREICLHEQRAPFPLLLVFPELAARSWDADILLTVWSLLLLLCCPQSQAPVQLCISEVKQIYGKEVPLSGLAETLVQVIPAEQKLSWRQCCACSLTYGMATCLTFWWDLCDKPSLWSFTKKASSDENFNKTSWV